MGHFHTFLGPSSLHLIPVVLEPDLHLGRGEADQAGQVLPLRGGQVPLLPEAALQFVGLRLGKQHPPFALLAGVAAAAAGRLLVVVRGLVVRGWLRGLGRVLRAGG